MEILLLLLAIANFMGIFIGIKLNNGFCTFINAVALLMNFVNVWMK